MNESFETRFARIMDMLHKLRSSEGHTARRLAKDYQVTVRTIYRDFDLLNSANFPLEDLGRGRGYRLSPDFRFHPQILNAKEVLPLVLGSQLFGGGGQRAALGKLRNYVVNGLERRLTDELADRVLPLSQSVEPWLEKISQAIAESRQALVEYQGANDEFPSRRLLEPSTLFLRHDSWYVDAYDHSSQRHKTFRLSRISSVSVLSQQQVSQRRPVKQADFHPWDIGDESIVEVTVEVRPELAKWLSENPAHPSQKICKSQVHYSLRCRDAFIRWLLGLSHAHLVGPPDMIELLQARLVSLLRQYQTTPP